MASSCCWLPPILIVFGVSGAGMIAAIEDYRPAMMVVTFSFLAAAFYFTYRPHGGKAADCCAESQAVELSGSTAAPDTPVAAPRKRRFNMMAMNKAMLWGVTVMAVVFLFFPQYMMSFFKPNDDITADMTSTVLKIEGMTCPG